MNIESLFAFLEANPAVRWGILAALLIGAGLLAILPPKRKKTCGACSKHKAAHRKQKSEDPLKHSQTLREVTKSVKNPNIYQKLITFNKKDVEFNITFPHPESWKRARLEEGFEPSTSLLQPTTSEETSWEPSEENQDMPPVYSLQLRCLTPLSGSERQAIHNYLATEGYIEDAHQFYKNLRNQ